MYIRHGNDTPNSLLTSVVFTPVTKSFIMKCKKEEKVCSHNRQNLIRKVGGQDKKGEKEQ